MKIDIITVGKLREKHFKKLTEVYLHRLKPYAKTRLLVVADEPVPARPSEAEKAAVLRREENRIKRHLTTDSYLVALDVAGRLYSSEELACHLDQLVTRGRSRWVFVIGGALGLSPDLLKRANLRLSLSPLTFPHEMVPVLLLEQLYRSFKIIRGEPYHK